MIAITVISIFTVFITLMIWDIHDEIKRQP